MQHERRHGAYRFRGHLFGKADVVQQRAEFDLVTLLCLAMAFGGGYLIGSCIG